MSQGHSQGDHQEPSLPPMGLNRPSTATDDVVRLDDTAAHPGQNLGQSIQAARDAKGMSAADLAQSLNLDLRIVEAIEGNRFEAAPDPIYVRAYLKHWARLLEVDPLPWIAAYNAQNAIESERQDQQRKTGARPTLDVMTPRKASRNVHVGKSGRPWIVVLALVVAFVVAAAALSAMPPAWQKWVEARLGVNVSTEMAGDRPIALIPLAPPGDDGKAPVGVPPSTVASAGTPASSAAMPPPDSASSAPGSSAMPATVLPALPSPPAPDQSVIAPAPTASPESDTSGAQGESSAAASSGTGDAPVNADQSMANLVIRATSADCWVEVRNAAGKRLVYDVLKSGEARQVPGDGPFTVVLGNPSAVEVLWKGAPVTLGTPNATTGVVRTTIGG